MLGRKEGDGEPVTGREPHLQSGLPQLVHPVYPQAPARSVSSPALPLTQPGPPRGPGKLLASGPLSHILPAPRSQAATSPPPSEVAGNTGAWLREAPGSPRHGSVHSAIGLKGLRARAAWKVGPAGWLWSEARRPFPPRPSQWDAGPPEQPGGREQGNDVASAFPSSCHKRQSPWGPEVAFPGERKALRGQSPCGGVRACAVDRVPPGSCLE